jgi:hypothetical protein
LIGELLYPTISGEGIIKPTADEQVIVIGIALEVRVAPPIALTVKYTSKFPTVLYLSIVIYLHAGVSSP